MTGQACLAPYRLGRNIVLRAHACYTEGHKKGNRTPERGPALNAYGQDIFRGRRLRTQK